MRWYNPRSNHRSSHRPGISRLWLALLCSGALAACAPLQPVQPWERGRLAQPGMSLEGDALLSAMDEHVYSSKEAASGTLEPAGGGCGCN